MPYRIMDAGRDLDWFIAERILGWHKEAVPCHRTNKIDYRWFDAKGSFLGWRVPAFTSDLRATDYLIEMVLSHDADLRMSFKRDGCKCSIMAVNGHIFIGRATSRPLALCRAIMQFYIIGLNGRQDGPLPAGMADRSDILDRYYAYA